MSYSTINVRFEDTICFLQFDRPAAKNSINDQLVSECAAVLAACEEAATVVIISGSAEYFCFGADFGALASGQLDTGAAPEALYDLWLRMATGAFVTISHIRGKVNAGGMGFIGASDIAVSEETAQFSLSELLFGLYPACVLPFLIRRVGFQRAHYLTLMTQPIAAMQALEWGLVDALDEKSEASLRRHLLRLRRLSKTAIRRYKAYMSTLNPAVTAHKQLAIQGNLDVFTDPVNVQAIARYVESGLFPWEKS